MESLISKISTIEFTTELKDNLSFQNAGSLSEHRIQFLVVNLKISEKKIIFFFLTSALHIT